VHCSKDPPSAWTPRTRPRAGGGWAEPLPSGKGLGKGGLVSSSGSGEPASRPTVLRSPHKSPSRRTGAQLGGARWAGLAHGAATSSRVEATRSRAHHLRAGGSANDVTPSAKRDWRGGRDGSSTRASASASSAAGRLPGDQANAQGGAVLRCPLMSVARRTKATALPWSRNRRSAKTRACVRTFKCGRGTALGPQAAARERLLFGPPSSQADEDRHDGPWSASVLCILDTPVEISGVGRLSAPSVHRAFVRRGWREVGPGNRGQLHPGRIRHLLVD
jgi:hypothetical protein